MLMTLLYMLLFGGSAAAEFSFVPGEKAVVGAVDNPRRQEQIIAILEGMKSAEQVLLDAYESRYTDLAEVSARHDADPERFREIISGLEETRLDVQGSWLDSRFSLKKHLTRTEWESVYGSR